MAGRSRLERRHAAVRASTCERACGCARLIHCEQVGTVGMIGQRLGRALDLERRAYPANASPPGARWQTGSLALLISFATCSCPARGTWLGRKITQSPLGCKITQSPTQGSLPLLAR